jgi:UPF0755 protein
MKQRKSPIKMLLLASLILALILAIVLGGILFLGLPVQAARMFGPPTTSLNTWQRVRLSAYLLWQAEEITSPTNPYAEAVPFQIGLGEAVPSIAARLKEAGIFINPDPFISYLQYTGLDTTIQAGAYELSAAMTPVEIAHAFQDATPKEVIFIILEGWRLEEIAETLPTTGLEITPQTFLEAASTVSSSRDFFQQFPPQATLEGFLLPDSYEVPRELTISQLLIHILDNFGIQVTFDIREGFERQGLNLFEAVSLASIVEREAVNEDEMPQYS